MVPLWLGHYSDRHGSEAITIHNDGRTLAVRIRGVAFRGAAFDVLDPVEPLGPGAPFLLTGDSLCACTIECDVPVRVTTAAGAVEPATLRCRIVLGAPDDRGGRDRVELALHHGTGVFATSGTHADFEAALIEVQRALPPGAGLKACISCAFSDYHPAGVVMFAGLACFRDNKAGYRAVHGKRELLAAWGTLTGFVQETYLCAEYERRGDEGYRGAFP
ncbi:DUF6304 family protein [Dactylosporangium sp. CA-052675]|uniref:DUF6304 family protein n=1 Tax=Dactylosporangium sp. CA-052675 TaxID=3239927 RepID=UPI003D9276F6